jgi:hypothetical protein
MALDLEGMVRDVPSARARYEDEVAQAQELVEKLTPGHYTIHSRKAENGYNRQAESRNWFFAIGGYTKWGEGTVTVKTTAGVTEYDLDFEYKFYDRYNWDAGKSVTFAVPGRRFLGSAPGQEPAHGRGRPAAWARAEPWLRRPSRRRVFGLRRQSRNLKRPLGGSAANGRRGLPTRSLVARGIGRARRSAVLRDPVDICLNARGHMNFLPACMNFLLACSGSCSNSRARVA